MHVITFIEFGIYLAEAILKTLSIFTATDLQLLYTSVRFLHVTLAYYVQQFCFSNASVAFWVAFQYPQGRRPKRSFAPQRCECHSKYVWQGSQLKSSFWLWVIRSQILVDDCIMLSWPDTIHKANYYCIFPPLGLQQEGYQEHGRYPEHIIVTACLWLLRACMKGLENKHQCLKRFVCFTNKYILLYVQGCIRALPDNF